MKYLLILLFLFSTQSFSGEIDGKGLDCKVINTEIGDGEEVKQMWWFNNGRVTNVWLDKPEKEELDKYSAWIKYSTTADTIKWVALKSITYYVDRKTLKITHRDATKTNNIEKQKINLTGTCKAFIGFKEVLKRQAEQLEDKRKKELEEQKEYDKAREGNKI